MAGAVVVPLELTGSNDRTTSATSTTLKTLPACSAGGCAVVNTVATSPPVTIFYGASCTGVHGSWFLNIVQQGPNDVLRPAYALRWSFAGSAIARPNGTVTLPPGAPGHATISLEDGIVTIRGSTPDNTTVTGLGTLAVALTGSASSPTLTFTESGLSAAESALGLVSPFERNGIPTEVPIRHKSQFTGC